MFINKLIFFKIFIEHIDDYLVYICTDLLIKHSVNMENINFDLNHFKQRLNNLKHYLFCTMDESDCYDSGYYDAINHVLEMMENN